MPDGRQRLVAAAVGDKRQLQHAQTPQVRGAVAQREVVDQSDRAPLGPTSRGRFGLGGVELYEVVDECVNGVEG